MDYFKLLKRNVIGRNSCYKLKQHNFIPGTIKTIDNHIIPILIGDGVIKKLAYKQILITTINKIIMKISLRCYQICNKTRKVKNIEYNQVSYKLSKSLMSLIYIKGDNTTKSNIKLLKTTSSLITISNTSLVPNYIKVMFSDFLTKDRILFNNLHYNDLMVLSIRQTISIVE
ncbi:50S ribosomal protein L25 [Candidatus Hodgkinia cicadicola]|uniref:50S ribosomal protein L25 n=1 Tax=Candidatus Hodgkinia cicadicola TaxID=573658 RepID=A0ABX4MHC2_9HYPH|nr:50S ribosomal protein L25 [Candidatus Hodgkinia cicadicola]